MPVAHNRNRYQEGSLDRVHRAKGPDVWVYRWRETTPEGKRIQRKRVIGTVEQYKTLTAAKIASDNLRLAINAPTEATVQRITVAEALGPLPDA